MGIQLDDAKYISFITYKKDGTAVPTPVWVVPFEGGYAFTTEVTSYKVKRVRNNPAAAAVACSMRGKVRPDATEYQGTAEVLDEATAARVDRLIKRKYWLAYTVAIAPAQVWRKLRGTTAAHPHSAVKFTVAP